VQLDKRIEAMLTHVLKPDTQAILLLCASFGQFRQTEPRPLNLKEYNALAQELQHHHLRPSDLLTLHGQDWLRAKVDFQIDARRLAMLLERAAMLGIAVERWTNKGLWVLSRSDEAYPQRLKAKLKQAAPPILYGIGNQALLKKGGLAIIGSRDINEDGLAFTRRVATTCAQQAIQVVSGGARGVDVTAMLATVEAGGTSVGVIADSLSKAAISKKYRAGVREGRLVLVSPYDPDTIFSVGNAMNRNKHVYALADHALVVSAAYSRGGTWAGATEELKRENRIPIWVKFQGEVPEGNHQLINLGAKSFPYEPWTQLLLLLEKNSQTEATVIPCHTDKYLEEVEEQSQVTITSQKSEQENVSEVPEKPPLPKDAYEAVLPLLLFYLQELRKEKQLARLLDVGPTQARTWLQRAKNEGWIKRTKQGYVVNEDTNQLSLLH